MEDGEWGMKEGRFRWRTKDWVDEGWRWRMEVEDGVD